ncbi:TlpA family protein disulfide reductase [Paenibacillus pinihumi]|uniref:TlpA family protein disulfide reductase n=1 Tax=Paenibacillus pinihumi TaxID=669462 RepID=UPI00042620D4|nr:hypothetical protein [Paenibacillus pinihumi]
MSNRKTGGSTDSGPPIGSTLPGFPPGVNKYNNSAQTKEATARVLLFVSMHCAHCIDLLPHIENMVQSYRELSFQLFTTGDEADNQSMIDYFGWGFPVHSLDQSDMEAYFTVTYLPFMIFQDAAGAVAAKGVIYNADEFYQIMKGFKSHTTA